MNKWTLRLIVKLCLLLPLIGAVIGMATADPNGLEFLITALKAIWIIPIISLLILAVLTRLIIKTNDLLRLGQRSMPAPAEVSRCYELTHEIKAVYFVGATLLFWFATPLSILIWGVPNWMPLEDMAGIKAPVLGYLLGSALGFLLGRVVLGIAVHKVYMSLDAHARNLAVERSRKASAPSPLRVIQNEAPGVADTGAST